MVPTDPDPATLMQPITYLAVTPILLIAGHGEVSGYRAPRGVGALLAGGGGRGRPLAL